MTELKTLKEKDWLKKVFNIRMAVVQVKPGETEKEAWRRHLTERPGDLHANIRVFHSRPIDDVPTEALELQAKLRP